MPQLTTNAKPEPQKKNLKLLRLVPWVLSILFIVSFFDPLDNAQFQVFGYPIYFKGFLRIISISGFIGYLTNWVAITMLFRPQRRHPVFRQGLIPSQKEIIAEKLSKSVSTNLISKENIRKKLSESGSLSKIIDSFENKMWDLAESSSFREQVYKYSVDAASEMFNDADIRKIITTKLVDHLDESMTETNLERIAFKAYKALRSEQLEMIIEKALLQIPETMYNNRHEMDEFIESLPMHIEHNRTQIEKLLLQSVDTILTTINTEEIILENLNKYDETRLERLIKDSTIEQLNYIKYLGGILGIFGGLLIWNPVLSVILLLSLGLTAFILDYLLMKNS